MTIRSAIATLHLDLKHFGMHAMVYDLIIRLFGRVVFFKILKVVRLTTIQKTELLPHGFVFREVGFEEFQTFANNREYEIAPVLLKEAYQPGNVCYGVFTNGVMANYVLMYSTGAQITDDLAVRFDPLYGYLCNTFTHHRYRGLHLNSIAVTLAAEDFRRRGFEELLAYVESHND